MDTLFIDPNKYLAEHDTDGLDISIASPVEATKITVERLRHAHRAGKDRRGEVHPVGDQPGLHALCVQRRAH